MLSSLLFFFFAIAISSEHSEAQPSTTPSPDAWKPDAKVALGFIRSSLRSEKDLPGAPGNGSLFDAEQSIVDALNKTDHSEIFSELANALRSDGKARGKIEAACPGLGKKRALCNIVCEAITISMRNLLAAMRKLRL
ncbi:unnamed protein product [Nippostrongylus brasiliensis]|uniref:Secreted protein n=1 Tax=Nippostrongylus brasiliensis TaxID=27835 RepID=A0A0N4XKI9_NIPBR|nr:unnamed protein product [Nippostrongylus brasiliensis]